MDMFIIRWVICFVVFQCDELSAEDKFSEMAFVLLVDQGLFLRQIFFSLQPEH